MGPYRGYTGTIEFEPDDKVFHGRIVGIRDIVAYEADNVGDLLREFEASVDAYLAMCAQDGAEPNKPWSGKLSLRTTPEIHALTDEAARRDGKSLNQWISDTIADAARKRIAGGSIKVRTR